MQTIGFPSPADGPAGNDASDDAVTPDDSARARLDPTRDTSFGDPASLAAGAGPAVESAITVTGGGITTAGFGRSATTSAGPRTGEEGAEATAEAWGATFFDARDAGSAIATTGAAVARAGDFTPLPSSATNAGDRCDLTGVGLAVAAPAISPGLPIGPGVALNRAADFAGASVTAGADARDGGGGCFARGVRGRGGGVQVFDEAGSGAACVTMPGSTIARTSRARAA